MSMRAKGHTQQTGRKYSFNSILYKQTTKCFVKFDVSNMILFVLADLMGLSLTGMRVGPLDEKTKAPVVGLV